MARQLIRYCCPHSNANRYSEAKKVQANFETHGGKGVSLSALTYFGQGSHTLMDNTSPAHSDFQVYSIPRVAVTTPGPAGGILPLITFTVINPAQFALELTEHEAMESREPTPAERDRAIADMQAYYRRIFGDEEYHRAIRPPRNND